MHGGEREQSLAKVANDDRVRLALLDLIFEGAEHRRECTEAVVKMEPREPALDL